MAQVEVVTAAERETANDEWLDRLADALRRDRERAVLCIVPTGRAARRLEERLLRESDLPGLFGSPIRTFYRLAGDIARDTRRGTHDLSDLQRSLLLRDIAAEAEVPTLAQVQQFPGLAAALGDLIGELKLAMVHPEELRRAQEQLPNGETELAAKLRDILTLYERYQEILTAEELHDAEGLMWHAVSAIEQRPDVLHPASVFFFHGFRSFNQVQLRLIKAIAGRAREVHIKLQHDPTCPEVFVPAQRTVETLRRDLACEPRAADAVGGVGDIAHIAANLFRAGAEPRPSDGSTIILESGSPAQEAEQVAREIQVLVIGAAGACNGPPVPDLAYGDIAIIARGAEARQRLSYLLARHGVPVSGRMESLAASAVGRCLVSCLQIVGHGWPASLVGSALKSPCLGGDAIEMARAEVAAWGQGISEGRRAWFEAWRGDDTLDARRRTLEPVKRLEDSLSQAKSPAEMAAAVHQFVDGLAPLDPCHPAAQRDDAVARQKLDQVIDEVQAIARQTGRRPSWQQFRNDLERAVAAAGYKPGPRVADGVAILDAQRLGGETYRVVLVVNLLENVFPAQVREDPFLRDRERRLLAAGGDSYLSRQRTERQRQNLSEIGNGPQLLDLAADRQAEERLLFWRALSCATDRLYLSYPAADEKAKEALRSFYIDEVERLFRDGLTKKTRRFSDLAAEPSLAVSAHDWATCIFHALARDLPPGQQVAPAAHYNQWRTRPDAQPGSYVSPAADYSAILSDPGLLAALAAREGPYRPSELETYLTCPYLYYCERLLELHTVAREVAPMDRGTVLHDVLARLYRDLRRQSRAPVDVARLDPAEVIARAAALLAECLERQPRFRHMPPGEKEIERQDLRAILTRFIPADLAQTAARGLRPAFFELQFGAPPWPSADERSRPDPLHLGDEGNRAVTISGRMDRLDLTADGRAVVIDYKLGKSGPPDMRQVREGLVLQAPLYAIAAREVFGLAVAGAEYVSLKGERRTGMYQDAALAAKESSYNLVAAPDEFDRALETAAAAARECVRSIRRGEIRRDPRDDCPAQCPARAICRVDAWTLRRIQAQRGAA